MVMLCLSTNSDKVDEGGGGGVGGRNSPRSAAVPVLVSSVFGGIFVTVRLASGRGKSTSFLTFCVGRGAVSVDIFGSAGGRDGGEVEQGDWASSDIVLRSCKVPISFGILLVLFAAWDAAD